MNKSTRIIMIVLIGIMVINLTACTRKGNGAVSSVDKQPNGTVAIALDYEKRNTYSSNQFAIWIEDLEGNFIKTVYVTSYTANGGYKKRAESIPVWVEKSYISSASREEIDAIAGPTPKPGSLMYIWNLTDETGQNVEDGQYKFYVEATIYEESRILFSGIIDISGEDTTVKADAEYTTELAEKEANITQVKAIWKSPVK